MPAELILQPTPDEALLQQTREQLTAARSLLADREAELAQLRAQLAHFEGRYFRQVGILYAELDDIEARIAEREVDLYDSDAARLRAQQARQRAFETQTAALDDTPAADPPDPPPTLKSLFREVARRIHPDFARDPAEAQHFTLLMARANQAYRRADIAALERLLDDHRELDAPPLAEPSVAELLRLNRQLAHARRDLAALDTEEHLLLHGDIAELRAEADAAALQHRDLLTELATAVSAEIAEARLRFETVNRQITAHGR